MSPDTDRTEGTAVAPDRAALHAAALRYLARYSATSARLLAVLHRRIERWAATAGAAGTQDAAAARAAAQQVVARLAEAGAVDDAVFAAQRARRLTRAGRSRRAVAAHLAERGVAAELAHTVLPADAEAELAAALVTARRRRIGPFRAADMPADAARLLRERGVLARAGFAQDVALRALAMPRAAAERAVLALRRG